MPVATHLIRAWIAAPGAAAIGWTILHSLWEGALIATALAIALWVLGSARARHVAAWLALLALIAAFAGTFAREWSERPQPAGLLAAAQNLPGPPAAVPQPGSAPAAISAFEAFLPWLAPFWLAGVCAFQLRTLAAWIGTSRLRRRGACCAPAEWQAALDRLRARVGMSRPAVLLESCLTEIPIAIGYFKPAVLVPVGMLAGLPPTQVESILLHELAHLGRYDDVLILFQTLAESLLFYHPATWWISAVICTERENCCDDTVLAHDIDAHEYAAALTVLEARRTISQTAALAATGGSLVKRIRRLLLHSETPRSGWAPAAVALLIAVAGALTLAAWQAQPAPATPPGPYGKWLREDVAYIITSEERNAFLKLTTDAEREQFIEQFWLRRDPTPGTIENEFKEEHYRRIAYANEHYAAASPGWTTDRGRIYIQYGPPDEIESHPGGSDAIPYPYEQWRYRYIEGIGNDVTAEFTDRTGTGDYRMTWDPAGAIVQITPDREMLVSIPLAFPAARYSITGVTRSANGEVNRFSSGASVCETAPGDPGCLREPVFRIGRSGPAHFVLPPGTYTLDVVVKDAEGSRQSGYTVNFVVK